MNGQLNDTELPPLLSIEQACRAARRQPGRWLPGGGIG
jgi:hypothetical protein